SARLRALPVSQHRAAVAVSALPRLEHVRRRTHRTGAGPDRSGSLGPGVITKTRRTHEDHELILYNMNSWPSCVFLCLRAEWVMEEAAASRDCWRAGCPSSRRR